MNDLFLLNYYLKIDGDKRKEKLTMNKFVKVRALGEY